MSGASSSTYPENLGSGGQLPAELGGRVSLFLYVCPSRYDARHRKPTRFVYALNSGGTIPAVCIARYANALVKM